METSPNYLVALDQPELQFKHLSKENMEGKKGEKEGGREGGREAGREGRRKGGREGEREEKREEGGEARGKEGIIFWTAMPS